MMENEKIALEILKTNKYFCIASSNDEGEAWASVVSYCMNSNLEFFFQSAMDCNHIENIRFAPLVSIAVYDSHIPVEFLDGVQMKGVVEQVDADMVDEVYEMFIDQVLTEDEKSRIAPPVKVFKGDNFPVLRFFKFIPLEMYKKDLTISGVARRVSLNMDEIRGLL